jgi:hypothetical protein
MLFYQLSASISFYSVAISAWSDEEIDYRFNATKSIPEGSNAAKEVTRCIEYMKALLA